MGKLVTPKVYFIGETCLLSKGLEQYLKDTGKTDFLEHIKEAKESGLSDGEILTSFYAKTCYDSTALNTDNSNKNITKIRNIEDNIRATIKQSHLSVFEHCQLNFIITDCSRVFSHELVRHRVGTAFSQTSGRYVRRDRVDIVFDPVLAPVKDIALEFQAMIEHYYKLMEKGLDIDSVKDMTLKKEITSALRRYLPNGQSNEVGCSFNLRTLRHIVQLRTSRHAEWEIRNVFAQIYSLVKFKYPLLFHDAKEKMYKGTVEVSGMRMQPYDTIIEETELDTTSSK